MNKRKNRELLFYHHLLPLPISCYGNNDIKTVEGSLERYAFDNIEITADDVDNNPEEPLLDIFASQSPKTYEAKSIGKGIEERNCGVGKGDEDIICGSPCQEEEYEGRQVQPTRHEGDRHVASLLLTMLLPNFHTTQP